MKAKLEIQLRQNKLEYSGETFFSKESKAFCRGILDKPIDYTGGGERLHEIQI